MRILVCGSRTFKSYIYLGLKLDRLTENLDRTKLIVVTGAQMTRDPKTNECYGADYLAEKWCNERFITYERFHADWDKHGKAAGPIRNSDMVASLRKKDKVVAFWDGKSPGTKDTIKKARKRGIEVRVFWPKENK